jgi:carboxymethylenebutenolidase
MSQLSLASRHDGFAIPAFHAPAEGARRGGVVVIQEIFGVTDHIEDMARQFAAAGYEAIAPALFARIDPAFHADYNEAGFAKGRAAVMATPFDQVAGDVQACLDCLDAPAFVTGFCYGGAVSWLAAARCEGLAGAAGFYGRLIATQMLDWAPKVPTILHYGRTDPHIPMTEVDAVAARHPNVPIHLYDAGHGFCRAGSPDYDAAAHQRSFALTLAHFAACAEMP